MQYITPSDVNSKLVLSPFDMSINIRIEIVSPLINQERIKKKFLRLYLLKTLVIVYVFKLYNKNRREVPLWEEKIFFRNG